MSIGDPLPLETFVAIVLEERATGYIINSWPIKLEILHALVCKHFQDLGIYKVSPFQQADIIRSDIRFFLQNSPQIVDMIDKARRAATLAAQRGKANSDV